MAVLNTAVCYFLCHCRALLETGKCLKARGSLLFSEYCFYFPNNKFPAGGKCMSLLPVNVCCFVRPLNQQEGDYQAICGIVVG